jgi:pro-apoptotic serine protease NMA111
MIVTSRATVPTSTCDLRLTIGERNIAGSVLYLGLVAVLTIDRNFLHPSISVPKICENEFKIGDEIELFALDDGQQIVEKRTRINDIGGIHTSSCHPPRWHISNTEGISILDTVWSNEGLLIDPDQKSIVALWMTVTSADSTYKIGLNYNYYIRPIIETLQNGEAFHTRCGGWVFSTMTLPNALQLGLSDQKAMRIAAMSKEIRAVPRPLFITGKLRAQTQVENLSVGDIILEINGVPVVRMADIRSLSHFESAEILVLRHGEEKVIKLHLQHLVSEQATPILSWAGAILHKTHDPVLEQITPEFLRISEREGFNPETGVYISSIMKGSPSWVGLLVGNWILEVDGCKVQRLDDMVKVISHLKASRKKEYVRIKMLGSQGTTSVESIKLDPKFWPAWILEQNNGKWVRTELE